MTLLKKQTVALRLFLIGFAVMTCLLCLGCAASSCSNQAWQHEMQIKLASYSRSSRAHLMPAFRKAKVHYPPKRLALLAFKESCQLELYARNRHQHWHYIKSFPILAASGRLGPKLRRGDKQVPEGVYRIILLNPSSHFDLSMELSYPNAFDRREAFLFHRHHLGNNIFIHGSTHSVGCIAIGDAAIEELFPLVAAVGVHRTTVIIAPDDFRRQSFHFHYGPQSPPWLPDLYHQIALELWKFPLPHADIPRNVGNNFYGSMKNLKCPSYFVHVPKKKSTVVLNCENPLHQWRGECQKELSIR